MPDSAIPTTREFTPDYSGTPKYNSEYRFESVVYPKDAPLLAQDLNESQAILNEKLSEFSGLLLTDGIINTGLPLLSDNGISVAEGETLFVSVAGKIIALDGPLSLEGSSVCLVFSRALVYGNDTIYKNNGVEPSEELENYLSDNDFSMELSRRIKYVHSETLSDGGCNYCDENWVNTSNGSLHVQVLKDGIPVYAKIKTDSTQGDVLKEEIVLAFNGFTGGTVTWGTTDDENQYEMVTEIQTNVRGITTATKTTVFKGENTIIETLKIEGGKTYIKQTDFSVDENGNDVVKSTLSVSS